jgi:2-deoxy-D-gluconate 3-dehydrogenase
VGRKAIIYTADLSSQAEVAALTPAILKDGHKINILVNCAGIQRRHPSAEFPDNDWNEVMPFSPVPKRKQREEKLTLTAKVLQVNLTTVFTLCRDIGAHMLSLPVSSTTNRRGSIINFASLLSFQGGLTVPAYSASKGAVAQLTKALSNEWASKGVNVNAIAPGYIETEMNTALLADASRLKSISERIPAGRWGKPEDFGGTTVYLASRASAYVSGHVLVVDGGWMGR